MASCMVLVSTVMAPTARSPPYFSREVLKHTAMRLSVDCMIKGDKPRARQGSTTLARGRRFSRRRRHLVLGPVRNRSTHAADTAWDRMVAMAAPRMPSAGRPNQPKIRMGSSTRLVTAPATSVSMLPKVLPTDCKNRWYMVPTKVPRQNTMQMRRYAPQSPAMAASCVKAAAKLSAPNSPSTRNTAVPASRLRTTRSYRIAHALISSAAQHSSTQHPARSSPQRDFLFILFLLLVLPPRVTRGILGFKPAPLPLRLYQPLSDYTSPSPLHRPLFTNAEPGGTNSAPADGQPAGLRL